MPITVEIHGHRARIEGEGDWTAVHRDIRNMVEDAERLLRRSFSYGSDPDAELTSAQHIVETHGGRIIDTSRHARTIGVPGRIY